MKVQRPVGRHISGTQIQAGHSHIGQRRQPFAHSHTLTLTFTLTLAARKVGDSRRCSLSPPLLPPHRYGYSSVVTIPAGATHILVRQQGPPGLRSPYLALKLADGSYALNGDYTLVPSPADVLLPGAVHLHYSGATAASETLTGHGPLAQPLTLQVLVAADPRGARLRYSFFVPQAAPSPARRAPQDWLDRKAQILEALRRRPWAGRK